jgi:hypothetical protein
VALGQYDSDGVGINPGQPAFDVASAESRWRANWPADGHIPVGPPANRVLFENGRVRVWHLELKPGEATALHTHRHPYFFIVMRGSQLSVKYADGSQATAEAVEGSAVWSGLDDATRTHVVINVGDQLCIERLIELL